jgi:hypothetical protein
MNGGVANLEARDGAAPAALPLVDFLERSAHERRQADGLAERRDTLLN